MRLRLICLIGVGFVAFGCGKKKSDDSPDPTPPPSSPPSSSSTEGTEAVAVDLSDEDFSAKTREIIPVGGLILTLLVGDEGGSPCGGSGPAEGTWECQFAKIFGDPATFPRIGSEGVLEGMILFDKVFKRATDTCNVPLAGAAQDVAGPFFSETRKYACTYDVPAAVLATAAQTSGIDDLASMTAADFADTKLFMYWGETGVSGSNIKNFIGVFDSSGDKAERAAFRVQQDKGTNTFEASNANAHTKEGVVNSSRYTIRGNWVTHEFEVTMRRSRPDTSSPLDWMTLKAKGVSQGAGNYYMYQVMGDGYTWAGTTYDPTTELTVCVDAATKKSVALSHCAAYTADLTAMGYLTTTEMPTSTASIPYPAL